jgi:hypothetical protein
MFVSRRVSGRFGCLGIQSVDQGRDGARSLVHGSPCVVSMHDGHGSSVLVAGGKPSIEAVSCHLHRTFSLIPLSRRDHRSGGIAVSRLVAQGLIVVYASDPHGATDRGPGAKGRGLGVGQKDHRHPGYWCRVLGAGRW